MKKILIILTVFTLTACSIEDNVGENGKKEFKSELGSKPVIIKFSYIEETFRKAEFEGNDAINYGLTYLEEPRSERKKIYVEIYEDITYGKLVEMLPSTSNFPADDFVPNDDFVDIEKIKYSDGIVSAYDKSGTIIGTETYNENYFSFDNIAESQNLKEVIINSFVNPKVSADFFIKSLSNNTNSRIINNGLVEINRELNSLAETPGNSFEVSKEKLFINKDLGFVSRIEGYTRKDELKDLEINFFENTTDGISYLKSSHYRNKQYSEAFDIYFLEYSDIFVNDFKFQLN